MWKSWLKNNRLQIVILITVFVIITPRLSIGETPYGVFPIFADESARYNNVSANRLLSKVAVMDSNMIYILDANTTELLNTIDLSLTRVRVDNKSIDLSLHTNSPGNSLHLDDNNSLTYLSRHGILRLQLDTVPKYSTPDFSIVDTTFKISEYYISDNIISDIGKFYYDELDNPIVVLQDNQLFAETGIIDYLFIYHYDIESRVKVNLIDIYREHFPSIPKDINSTSLDFADKIIYRTDITIDEDKQATTIIYKLDYSDSDNIKFDTLVNITQQQPIYHILGGEHRTRSYFAGLILKGAKLEITLYNLNDEKLIIDTVYEVRDISSSQSLYHISDRYLYFKAMRQDGSYKYTEYSVYNRLTDKSVYAHANNFNVYSDIQSGYDTSLFIDGQLGSFNNYSIDQNLWIPLIEGRGKHWFLDEYEMAWSVERSSSAGLYGSYFAQIYKNDSLHWLPFLKGSAGGVFSFIKPTITSSNNLIYTELYDVIIIDNIESRNIINSYPLQPLKNQDYAFYYAKGEGSLFQYYGDIAIIKYMKPKEQQSEETDVLTLDHKVTHYSGKQVLHDLYIFDDGTFTVVDIYLNNQSFPSITFPNEEMKAYVDSVIFTAYDHQMDIVKQRVYDKETHASDFDEFLTLPRLEYRNLNIQPHDPLAKTLLRANGSIYDLWDLEYAKQPIIAALPMKTFFIPDSVDFGIRYQEYDDLDYRKVFYNCEIFDKSNPLNHIELIAESPITTFYGVQEDYIHFTSQGRIYHRISLEDISTALLSIPMFEEENQARRMYIIDNFSAWLQSTGIEKYSIYDLSGSLIEGNPNISGIYIVHDTENRKTYWINLET